ncbi:MAG: hypothetical protein V7542_13055 [Limnobacter sp.]|uniref:hypothetical protein n=1 Tax=Limnobacter sp. TaxID=2003368 RepID=UPI0030039006
MINPKSELGTDSRSSQGNKHAVSLVHGLHTNQGHGQRMVRINPDANQLFTGAFSGLNMPQFAKLGTGISVAKCGYVVQRQQHGGAFYVRLAVPVYSAADHVYHGMLFVNLACSGPDSLEHHSIVKVLPSLWAHAVDDGKNCWVSGLSPAEDEPEYNPFYFAAAKLPSKLNQAGSTAISASSLFEFLSEAFRLLTLEDRNLYLGIMLQSNRFSKFLRYAASTRSHHNGDHGLLLHTAETVANILLDFLAASSWQRSIGKPAFDLSLTLLAALLHDAAKVDDYYRLAPDVYSTNLNCKLLGHEQTMLKWIGAACAVSGGYPVERELQLEHAICAVKRQHDQSGARKRKTAESFVLHDADCASARAFDKGEKSVLLAHHFVRGESV